jgi:hypothetical protein
MLRAVLAAPLVLAACTTAPPPPPPPDPLAELAATARADAATATAVAAAVPALAAAATAIGTARSEHAAALQREVDRAQPPKPSTSSSAPSPPAPVDPATAKTTLVNALTAAEKRAGELITSVSRYRAGLLGSVAAGCASLREVLA